MASDSATGGTFLSDDQDSRAIQAALRAAGKAPDDLRVAQAYDEAGASDLSVLAVTVDGLPAEQTRDIVLENWLAASGDGVTKDTVTLDGQDVDPHRLRRRRHARLRPDRRRQRHRHHDGRRRPRRADCRRPALTPQRSNPDERRGHDRPAG